MDFNKTFYKLKTNDGREIVEEAWENGVRFFKIQNSKGITIKEARKTPHHCEEQVQEAVVAKTMENPLSVRISYLEAKIAELEIKLDNKLDKDK